MKRSAPTGQTRRQEIITVLSQRELSFEALRAELGLSVKLLADDLSHISKSLARGDRSLHVLPARCSSCGFVFRKRERFHTPSRCPKCRSESIHPARLRVE